MSIPLSSDWPRPVFIWFAFGNELSVPWVRNFAYFDYRGTFPPTIYSAVREPYRYVVEVRTTESDGHERSLDELLRAARILISNHLGPSAAEEFTGRAPNRNHPAGGCQAR
jgi:hypothetical protein